MAAHITRRAVIIGAVSSTAVAALPVAAVAEAEPEAPHVKVHRLADELAAALRDWPGFKRAIVTPELVMFEDPRLLERMETSSLDRFERLVSAFRKADAAFLEAADARDEAGPSAIPAAARIDATFNVADDAFLAICGHVPCSHHDARAKRDFLLAWTKDSELEPRHVEALLRSMGGANG